MLLRMASISGCPGCFGLYPALRLVLVPQGRETLALRCLRHYRLVTRRTGGTGRLLHPGMDAEHPDRYALYHRRLDSGRFLGA